jgi:hypothetical protein
MTKKKLKKDKHIQMTITIHPNDKRRIGNIAKMTKKTEAEVVRQFIRSAFDAVDIIDEQSLGGDVGGQLQHLEEPTNFHEYSEDKIVMITSTPGSVPAMFKKKIGFRN